MKIRIKKTGYFFGFNRYPARFGYHTKDGKDIDLGEGDIVVIRIFGIEITIDLIKKKK